MRIQVQRYSLVLCVVLAACIEPFDPPVRNSEVGFLVIDGYINTSTQSAMVKISRAIALSESGSNPVVTNCTVTIEDGAGNSYKLMETQPGDYALSHPNFLSEKTFKLYVSTPEGKRYQSAVIKTKAAPPIENLAWTSESDGINIVASTNDPSRNTLYYRWEYIETWKYESFFSSESRLVGGEVIFRTLEEQVKTCYRTEVSNNILTASTEDFAEDRITNREVIFLPKGSEKLRLMYSILVKQYALSKEAFEYWEQLKVNTETLGGLFDPQPSRVKGNITSEADANEPVIGYFDGGGVAEKRIFIKREDLPEHLSRFPVESACIEETIPAARVHELAGTYMITNAVYNGPEIVAYNYTTPLCADCTLLGGVTQKPEFWPK
jgi:hypothetical protein